MKDEYDIFISYSIKDSPVVHEYAKYLEGLGYKVWYDVEGLYGGDKFTTVIADAIESSRLFVFFSSENSNKSEWTKGEILLAKKLNKTILPIRIDDTEYDKSVMIVLLPLQYIYCKNKVDLESRERLKNAIIKYIGDPSPTVGPDNGDAVEKRKNVKRSIVLSAVASLFFSFFMLFVSGEFHLNISLSLFAVIITAVFCFLSCLYVIYLDKHWNDRSGLINTVYLLGLSFFLSYSLMAFGLCFVSVDVFLLNFPSIICAVLAICSMIRLMAFRKEGYYFLWLCVLLFSIGSYWWLQPSILAPVIIAVLGSLCMLVLTGILKKKYNGISMWSRLS